MMTSSIKRAFRFIGVKCFMRTCSLCSPQERRGIPSHVEWKGHEQVCPRDKNRLRFRRASWTKRGHDPDISGVVTRIPALWIRPLDRRSKQAMLVDASHEILIIIVEPRWKFFDGPLSIDRPEI